MAIGDPTKAVHVVQKMSPAYHRLQEIVALFSLRRRLSTSPLPPMSLAL